MSLSWGGQGAKCSRALIDSPPLPPQSSSAYLSGLYGASPVGAFPHQHPVSPPVPTSPVGCPLPAVPRAGMLFGVAFLTGDFRAWGGALGGGGRENEGIKENPSLSPPAPGAGGCQLVHPNAGGGGHHREEGAAHQAAGAVRWRLHQGELRFCAWAAPDEVGRRGFPERRVVLPASPLPAALCTGPHARGVEGCCSTLVSSRRVCTAAEHAFNPPRWMDVHQK